ncbi:MAG: putative quinol monooxygenase [Rubrivivax sp.]
MLIVLGSVLARHDTLEEARRLSTAHVERSRQEPGCLAHAVHIDVDEPLRLVFVERWTDWDALRAHFQVPASVAFARDLARLGAAAPEMTIYEATPSRMPSASGR